MHNLQQHGSLTASDSSHFKMAYKSFFMSSTGTRTIRFEDEVYLKLLAHIKGLEAAAKIVYQNYSQPGWEQFLFLKKDHIIGYQRVLSLLEKYPKEWHSSRFAWEGEISKVFAIMTKQFAPQWVYKHTQTPHALTFESALLHRYNQAFDLAPKGDKCIIGARIKSTRDNIGQLKAPVSH